jgi:hypothetical protein
MNVQRAIAKTVRVIRVIAYCCIGISLFLLVPIILIASGLQFGTASAASDNAMLVFILTAYVNMYAIVFGTLPSLALLVAMHLYTKHNKALNIQPIRKELWLLCINILIVLLAVGIMYFMEPI